MYKICIGKLEFLYSSLLPGHKLEWPIFTTAYPVPRHERVNECCTDYKELTLPCLFIRGSSVTGRLDDICY